MSILLTWIGSNVLLLIAYHLYDRMILLHMRLHVFRSWMKSSIIILTKFTILGCILRVFWNHLSLSRIFYMCRTFYGLLKFFLNSITCEKHFHILNHVDIFKTFGYRTTNEESHYFRAYFKDFSKIIEPK